MSTSSKPYVSVVLATWNKPEPLRHTLASIFRQQPPFPYEVIVVDDGSQSEDTLWNCWRHKRLRQPILYLRSRDRGAPRRNPAFARNIGYRRARGEIVVCQSDEVIHVGLDTLEKLTQLDAGTYNIATVWNARTAGLQLVERLEQYTGHVRRAPYFFLGSLWRKDLYAIGGNSEVFTEPGFDDDWFAACLWGQRRLAPHFRGDIEGWHQDHSRPEDIEHVYDRHRPRYFSMLQRATVGEIPWRGGPPWDLETGQDLEDVSCEPA